MTRITFTLDCTVWDGYKFEDKGREQELLYRTFSRDSRGRRDERVFLSRLSGGCFVKRSDLQPGAVAAGRLRSPCSRGAVPAGGTARPAAVAGRVPAAAPGLLGPSRGGIEELGMWDVVEQWR